MSFDMSPAFPTKLIKGPQHEDSIAGSHKICSPFYLLMLQYDNLMIRA